MPPPTNDSPRRKNGFSTPYTGAQLSTWVALPMLVVEFVLLVAPVLPLAAMIPCTIIFALTAVLAAYYAFLAQYIDPMDEHLAKHLQLMEESNSEAQLTNHGFGSCLGGVNDEVEPLKHCWICDTQVAEHAMHCKFCNKCVGNFDHHCMWLNTCVGKANYQYFLLTMLYITAMLVVHCFIQIALIIDIFMGGSTKQRADEWFETKSPSTIAGVYIGFVVFDLICLSLILQLLQFHVMLRKEGLTTYRYIVRETQRKREKTNQEQARKNQRMLAMGKANDEGNTCLALRLRLGETCQFCDPLPPLEEQQKRQDTQNNPQPPDSPSSNDTSNNEVPPQPPHVEADLENEDGRENDVATSNGVSSETSNGDSIHANGNSCHDQVKFVNVANGNGEP